MKTILTFSSQGRCGMFSHFSYDTPPSIEVPHKISVQSCLQMHQERKFTWKERSFSLALGENSFALTTEGSLRYDQASGSVSCQGKSIGLKEGSEQQVDESILFESLNIKITKEQGKQLLAGQQSLVITSGEDHGVELSREEVQRGGVSLRAVTYALDPIDDVRHQSCPLAVLRKKVDMIRIAETGDEGGKGDWRDAGAIKNDSLRIKSLIWTNADLALHQKQEIKLPEQCQITPGTRFFQTNHDQVILSPNASPQFIATVQENPLDYLSISNLGENSRADLTHAHVDQMMRNLSSEIERLECVNQIDQLLKNEKGELPSGQKKRFVRAGELLYQMICERIEVQPGYKEVLAEDTCTKDLPVYIRSSQHNPAYQARTLFLEPVTRYLSFSSKRVPCEVQALAPPIFETRLSNYIFWNGSSANYLKKEVLAAEKLKKKYEFLEKFDLNDDMETDGLESDKMVRESNLFLEYSQFVETDRREDLQGSPPVWSNQGSGAAQRAHSWFLGTKALSRELTSSALAASGLGWTTKVIRGIEELLDWLKPLALCGGLYVAMSLIVSGLMKLGRLVIFSYAMPGAGFRQLLSLSISGESRTKHQIQQEMQDLLETQVADGVQTHLAIMRAESRQDA